NGNVMCEINGASLSSEPNLNTPGVDHFTKYLNCQNGATKSPGKCHCVVGYYGDECQHIVKDCEEVVTILGGSNRMYLTHPPGVPSPIEVRCTDKWTMIYQKRSQTGYDPDIYTDWEGYKFGYFTAEFGQFLGLDMLHLITSNSNYQVKLKVNPQNDLFGTDYVYTYDSIYVANETEKYKLTLGSMVDFTCLGNTCDTDPDIAIASTIDPAQAWRGMKFTTTDSDNDMSATLNCADELEGGGWWYNDCTQCGITATSVVPPSPGLERLCMPEMLYKQCSYSYCMTTGMMILIKPIH
ncbi:unnamed protein product, partial [Owenia fusiformis]